MKVKVVVLAMLLVSLPIFAVTIVADGISVKIETNSWGEEAFYLPISVEAKNLSDTSKNVQVLLTHNSWNSSVDYYVLDIGDIEPSGKSELDCMVGTRSLARATLKIDGKTYDRKSASLGYLWAHDKPQYLITNGNNLNFAEEFFSNSILKDKKNKSLVYASLEKEDWVKDFRIFFDFSSILVTQNEWEGYPDKLRDSLLKYVRMGGTLTIFGAPETASFGQMLSQDFARGKVCYSGFGRLVLCYNAMDKYDYDKLKSIIMTNASAIWQDTYPSDSIDKWFTIGVGPDGKSAYSKSSPALMVKLFMYLAGLFLVIITISMLLKLRTNVFWVLPVISIICAVVVLILAGNYIGKGIYGRQFQFCVVDHNSGFVSSASLYGFYSSRDIPGDITFENNEIFSSISSNRSTAILTLSQDKSVLKKVAKSGYEGCYRLLRHQSYDGGEMSFELKDGAIWATNGYKMNVLNLYYKDKSNVLWKLDMPLEPGDSAIMVNMGESLTPYGSGLCNFIRTNWVKRASKMSESLIAGAYFASTNKLLIESDCAIEPTAEQKVECWIYGVAEGDAK